MAIKDVNFKASLSGNNVVCSWLNDIQVNKFELQKSYDGTTFSTITTINRSTSPNYTFYDTSNSKNISVVYYRLRFIEKSNQADCSSVSSVSFKASKMNILVYPNPIHNTIYFSGLGLSKVVIYDASGKIVSTNTANANNVQNNFTPNLKKGVYFLKMLLADGEIQTEKIIYQP